MAAPRKITPELENEILVKAALGLSTRAISEWLETEKNVKLGHQAIARVLKQTRQVRAEVTKVVLREQLAKTVISDIDRLDKSLGKVGRLERRAHDLATVYMKRLERTAATQDGLNKAAEKRDQKNFERAHFFVDAALKSTDRVRALANTKLHFSGAGEEDEGGEFGRLKKGASDELLERLDGLATRLAAAGRATQSDPGPET